MRCLLLDTLDGSTLPALPRVIAVTPGSACDEVRTIVSDTTRQSTSSLTPRAASPEVMPQIEGDLGARMQAVMATLFREGAQAVVLIGSDLPHIVPDTIAETLDVLARDRDALVLGPASDGGYYLIASRRLPDVFTGIEWGSDRVFASTIEAATIAGFRVHQLPGNSPTSTRWMTCEPPLPVVAHRARPPGLARTCSFYRLLPTAYRLLPTACLLPTAYRLLPTAYRLLPTAYRLLPTAYRWAGRRILAAFRGAGLMLWIWCMATSPGKTPSSRSRWSSSSKTIRARGCCTRRYLTDSGFRTIEAHNGFQAFEKAQTHHPDAVVTDLAVPGMDGFEFCRALRASASTKDVPIVAITGYPDYLTNPERIRQAGITRVMTKPCNLENIVLELRRLLNGQATT